MKYLEKIFKNNKQKNQLYEFENEIEQSCLYTMIEFEK